MIKSINTLYSIFIFLFICLIAFSSCKNGQSTIPPASVDYSYVQEFDSISAAHKQGWVTINNSRPLGTESWTQAFPYYESKKGFGNATFDAQSYKFSGSDFIMITSNCGSDISNTSAWLISPKTTMKNGDQIVFYSRTYANPALAADRLEVRLNPINNSDDVGSDSSSVGDFKTVLTTINPNLKRSGTDAYPAQWTKYTVPITGITTPSEKRFAFRYYVPGGGPDGLNGLGIGIDSVAFISK